MRGGPSRGHGLAILLALLTLAPALTGCISRESLDAFVYQPRGPKVISQETLNKTAISEPIQDLVVEYLNFSIASFDTIPLAADVWKPAGSGPFPVVLILSPYFEGDKDPERGNLPAGGLYRQTIDTFVPRGYAVALVDLRGTRNSDGCMDLGGPNEQRDAAAVVEYLGTQPWSNGKVGMIGVSYDGFTQQMAAVNDAPHLAAIVPIAPVADWYHGVGKGGAKFQGWVPNTAWNYNMMIGMGLPPLGGAPTNSTAPNGTSDPRVARANDQACAVVNQAFSDDPTGDENLWMKERKLWTKAAQAKAPMYYVHGFVDVNARPDHIDPWYTNYGGPKKAFLWQKDHDMPALPNTGRSDFWISVVQWFDYHLLGLDNGVPATYGRVEVQDNLGRWRYEESWPPKDVQLQPWLLGGEKLTPGEVAAGSGGSPVLGALPMRGDASGGAAVSWTDDVLDDGGAFGSRSTAIGTSSASRLAYRSEPLAEDLHYAGRPVVHAVTSTNTVNSFVVVRLYDVLPDGSWVLLNRGVHSFRHRDGLDNPQLAMPGQAYTIEAAMQPNDYVFPKGHAIGLTITSSDSSYILPSGTQATNTLQEGASALLLPVIHRDQFEQTTWGPTQPAWMGPDSRGPP